MTNHYQEQASDLYFARHSGETDSATVAEIAADLVRFVAKVERSELTAGIKRALIAQASR